MSWKIGNWIEIWMNDAFPNNEINEMIRFFFFVFLILTKKIGKNVKRKTAGIKNKSKTNWKIDNHNLSIEFQNWKCFLQKTTPYCVYFVGIVLGCIQKKRTNWPFTFSKHNCTDRKQNQCQSSYHSILIGYFWYYETWKLFRNFKKIDLKCFVISLDCIVNIHLLLDIQGKNYEKQKSNKLTSLFSWITW